MPTPNQNILHSLFEFYLNYRAPRWKLDIKNPAESKLDPESEKKRSVCIDALKSIKKPKEILGWIETSYELYDLECKCKKADPSWFTWASNKVGQERVPLLAKLICAARAYINSKIKNESDYIETVNLLSAKAKESAKKMLDLTQSVQGDISETKKSVEIDKSKLIELKLKALTENQDYQKSFYISIIKVKDPESEKLNEQSFDDFISNVLNGSRKSPMCLALVPDKKLLEPKPAPSKKKIQSPTATKGIKTFFPPYQKEKEASDVFVDLEYYPDDSNDDHPTDYYKM